MLEESGPAGKALMEESAIEADDVVTALLAAILAGRFLVLPHPEVGAMYAGRAADPDRWLRGMRRQSRSLPSQWSPERTENGSRQRTENDRAAQSLGPPAT
jgi:hypothetical protein